MVPKPTGSPWRRLVTAWDVVLRAGVPFAGRYTIAEPVLGLVSVWWACSLSHPAAEFRHVYAYRILRTFPTEWGAIAITGTFAVVLGLGFLGYLRRPCRGWVMLLAAAWWTFVGAAILFADPDAPAVGTYLGLALVGLFGYLRFQHVSRGGDA